MITQSTPVVKVTEEMELEVCPVTRANLRDLLTRLDAVDAAFEIDMLIQSHRGEDAVLRICLKKESGAP